jgi:hypothetical protein
MTPEELTAKGRAIHGERWQTALAHDLGVTDRTLRRWLAGASAIPDGVEAMLQGVLAKRLRELGGQSAFTVNLADRQVVHIGTNACFGYSSAGDITFLNPQVVSPHDRAVVSLAAAAFVRGMQEPAVVFEWGPPSGGTYQYGRAPDHDAGARMKRIQEIMEAARTKLADGPEAARSADFLYDEAGLPK